MAGPAVVERSELKAWADRDAARAELPRVIRRLIFETAPGLVELGVPASEGATSQPGWDGVVRSPAATPWVPEGLSLWELSVSADAQRKATRDYNKREETGTPDGSPAGDATYVALSLREWRGRAKWAQEHDERKRWRAVRAHGLDDVDAWLETAPVTSAWFAAAHLGRHPYGLRSGEAWWDWWSQQTQPRLPPELVLAGRGEQAEKLIDALADEPGVTTVSASGINEACAFIVAAVRATGGQQAERLLARLAFVDDLDTWRELMLRTAPLILAPMRPGFHAEVPQSDSQHHIVVPITRGKAQIKLPRIDAGAAAAALSEAGMAEDEARRAGRLARRSLTALRVHLAPQPELLTPAWASGTVGRDVRGVLLAGSWEDTHEQDQAVLKAFAGKEYEDLRESLSTLEHPEHLQQESSGVLERYENPMVYRVDDSWHLVAAEDAWEFLHDDLLTSDLERLHDMSLQVLGERDPTFDMDPDSQWRAGIQGKSHAYSHDLRRGLARSLVLLSLHDDSIGAPRHLSGDAWAAGTVRALLPNSRTQPIAGDGKATEIWASLHDVLPLLAEAAPDVFMHALQDHLENDASSVAALFTDSGGASPYSGSPHTALLWALEVIAWPPDYFGAVVDVLVDLHRIDPGGRLANRPLATLASLFCPWGPHTSASPSQRLEVLDKMREPQQCPEIAWQLMVELIPQPGRSVMPTAEPRYRDWATEPARRGYDNKFVDNLTERIIEDATQHSERLIELLQRMRRLPEPFRGQIIDSLDVHIDSESSSPDQMAALWEAVRYTAGDHSKHSTTDFALSQSEISKLQDIAARIKPQDPIAANQWLFAQQYPVHDILSDCEYLHQRYVDKLARLRRDAVIAIYRSFGLAGLRRLTSNFSDKNASVYYSYHNIGVALADGLADRVESELLEMLHEDSSDSDWKIAAGYFRKRFQDSGWDWLERLLPQSSISDIQLASLLAVTRDYPRSWERAAELGATVKAEYWKLFNPQGLGTDFAYKRPVVEELLNVHKPYTALKFMFGYGITSKEIACLAAQALEMMYTNSNDDRRDSSVRYRQIDTYLLEKILTTLNEYKEAIGVQRVARIEWALLLILPYNPDAESSTTLRQLILEDPSFFVEVICIAFTPANQRDEYLAQFNEQERQELERKARAAIHLLDPFVHNEDAYQNIEFSLSELREWVAEARRLLCEVDRLVIGEQQIGQLLARLPTEPGGLKPAPIVRDLLEEIKRQHIEVGISLGISNSRGVTSRGLEEGGAQELTLAAEYQKEAEKAAHRWPRTARIFRDLARQYETEGRSEEEDAERFRSGLD